MSTKTESRVFVVDDDEGIRIAMAALMDSVGLDCQTFASADQFLEQYDDAQTGCLVLDIRMPGLGGLQLQKALNEKGCTLPIVFITGYADVPMAVEAMQNGAVDFIEKPFREEELLACVQRALAMGKQRRDEKAETAKVAAKFNLLTARERQVLDLVASGKANKIIAYELSLSQRTVEIHRARVMEKMQAASLAQLIRMHLRLRRPL